MAPSSVNYVRRGLPMVALLLFRTYSDNGIVQRGPWLDLHNVIEDVNFNVSSACSPRNEAAHFMLHVDSEIREIGRHTVVSRQQVFAIAMELVVEMVEGPVVRFSPDITI
jgi:hypothetical protein